MKQSYTRGVDHADGLSPCPNDQIVRQIEYTEPTDTSQVVNVACEGKHSNVSCRVYDHSHWSVYVQRVIIILSTCIALACRAVLGTD
jgi:hypothetical protein